MGRELTESGGGEAPADAALRWMARKLSGVMSAEERAALDEWLAAAADHRQAWSKLEAAAGQLDARGEALLAEEFERQLAAEAARDAIPRRRFGRLAIAAGVAAAIAIAGVIMLFAAPSPRAIEEAVYATEIGEIKPVAFVDGSRADLNASSRIAVSFTARERRIDLIAGEAFFVVAKDPRPFLVTTQTVRVKAMGTSFSVSSFDDKTVVHVLEGTVEVAPIKGETARLVSGEMLEIEGGGPPGPVVGYDPDVALAWRSGKIRFRSAPLRDVLAEANRYFTPPIVIPGTGLLRIPVTGEFDIKDRAAAVAALNDRLIEHYITTFRAHAPRLLSEDLGAIAGEDIDGATVAVVEFFDYHCEQCRLSAKFVGDLISDDPDVIVALRELPVLREESAIASRYALAARAQGKYLAFHFALLGETEPLTEERILDIGRAAGLDVDRLKRDQADPAFAEIFEANRRFVEDLGFSVKGEPIFLIGTRSGYLISIVSGFRPAQIERAIAEAKRHV